MSKNSERGSKESQEAIRKRGFELIKKGLSGVKIAAALGVSRSAVTKWKKAYLEKGVKAAKSSKRGVKTESGRLLTQEQESEIVRLIVDKCPDQLKMPFVLWTRQAVRELIKDRFRIKIAERTVGDYLKRWNFTPQKPIKRAYERNDKKVKKWLDEEYPAIKKLAKKEKAEIHWGDETSCVSMPSYLRGYSPRGETPVLKHSAKKFKINMISTVTNQGKVRFMVYEEKMDAGVFIRFLKRLIKTAKKKIFLILDNLSVHHSKKVKAWVKENKDKIALYYIPAYSPDLNPDEYLNCDFKANANKERIPRNKEELKENTRSFMKGLQRKPERVKGYFRHKAIAYAA